MRYLKVLIPLLCIVVIIMSVNSYNDFDLCGTYISRDPTHAEMISIMYIRGNSYSAHTAPDNQKLTLNTDSTFT